MEGRRGVPQENGGRLQGLLLHTVAARWKRLVGSWLRRSFGAAGWWPLTRMGEKIKGGGSGAGGKPHECNKSTGEERCGARRAARGTATSLGAEEGPL